MLYWYQYLWGVYYLKIDGGHVQRFINLCGMRKILLWNIQKTDDHYTMCIARKDYQKIESLQNKAGCHIAITKAVGVPELIPVIRKKRSFFFGAGICFCLLYLSSFFVWSFQCVGNTSITKEQIAYFLKENDIHFPLQKKRLDLEELEDHLRTEYADIRWSDCSLDGSKLMISMKEETDLSQEIATTDVKQYENLYADADGIIKSIIVRRGVPKVKAGDIVKCGDVLIEGSIPINDDSGNQLSQMLVKADGDVFVETDHILKKEFSRYYREKKYTSTRKYSLYLNILGLYIKIPFYGWMFENCDVLTSFHPICILPQCPDIGMAAISVYREYESYMGSYNDIQMQTRCEDHFEKIVKTLEEKGVQIISKNVTIKKNNQKWEMIIRLKTILKAGEETILT